MDSRRVCVQTLALGVVAAFLVACGESGPPRLVLVGVDGASWKVIGPLIDRGELPAFARLMREGAYAPEFDTMEPTSSPVIWTTIATGRSPDAHGITWSTQTLANGDVVPVSSRARRVKAIWNVATEAGLSVGVIGWWASWPAEKVSGYVITDHANPASSGWMIDDGKYWTADPDALSQVGHDYYPADLGPILLSEWFIEDAFPAAEMQQRSGLSDVQMQVLEEAPWFKRTTYSWLKTFYAVDYPHVKLALRLGKERPTDLQMVYLRGPDPVQHYAWDLVEPEYYQQKRRHFERDRGVVEGIYRYVDSFLLEVLDAVDSRTTLIVVSDHGAEPTQAHPVTGKRNRPGRHTYAAKGVLFIHGPNVRAGQKLTGGRPHDIMPTIAWLLGLPIADDLDGRVLTEAFDEDFAKVRPVTRVASYGAREVKEGLASPEDEALLEQLRSLGYIE